MPKAQQPRNWRDDPVTDAQITKLLVMLREAEVIEAERGCPLEEYKSDAVDWCNQELTREIRRLEDLTKGEIQSLYERLQ